MTEAKDLLEKISFEQLQEKCSNGEIDINSAVSKVWAVYYLSGKPEEQAIEFLNFLVDAEICHMVELDPGNIFEKIYFINNNTDEREDDNDIFFIFKDGEVDQQKLQDMYEDTIDEFTVKSYIEERAEIVKTKQHEIHDPNGLLKRQAELDDIKEAAAKAAGKPIEEVTMMDVLKEIQRRDEEEIKKMAEEIKADNKNRTAPAMTQDEFKAKVSEWFEGTASEKEKQVLEDLNMTDDEKLEAMIMHVIETNKLITAERTLVNFDLENTFTTPGDYSLNNLGLQTLSNGLTFYGIVAGGDWEHPVYSILYHDDKTFRMYIPTEGNIYNTDSNKAFGNDEDEDKTWEQNNQSIDSLVFDENKMISDIISSISVK